MFSLVRWLHQDIVSGYVEGMMHHILHNRCVWHDIDRTRVAQNRLLMMLWQGLGSLPQAPKHSHGAQVWWEQGRGRWVSWEVRGARECTFEHWDDDVVAGIRRPAVARGTTSGRRGVVSISLSGSIVAVAFDVRFGNIVALRCSLQLCRRWNTAYTAW